MLGRQRGDQASLFYEFRLDGTASRRTTCLDASCIRDDGACRCARAASAPLQRDRSIFHRLILNS